jgi:hypothetical protein
MGNQVCAGDGGCKDPGVKCAGNGKCKTPPFCAGHAAVVKKIKAGCQRTKEKNYLDDIPKEALEALSRPWWER